MFFFLGGRGAVPKLYKLTAKNGNFQLKSIQNVRTLVKIGFSRPPRAVVDSIEMLKKKCKFYHAIKIGIVGFHVWSTVDRYCVPFSWL